MIAPVVTTPLTDEPGVYFGVPMEEYLALPAVGSSLLADVGRSPAYAKMRTEKRGEGTAATDRGSLVHALLMEPDLVDRSFVRGATCEAILKSGDRRGQPCGCSAGWYLVGPDERVAYCGKHASPDLDPDPRVVVSDANWQSAEVQAANLRELEAVERYLEDPVGTEVCLVWVEDVDGVLVTCKARVDLWPSEPVFVDVKANVNAHPARWPSEVLRRRAHIQAAHYLRGAEVLDLGIDRWRWALVDSTPPHEAWAPWCDADTMQIGTGDRQAAIETWARCVRAGHFDGYPQGDDEESGLPEHVKARRLLPAPGEEEDQ